MDIILNLKIENDKMLNEMKERNERFNEIVAKHDAGKMIYNKYSNGKIYKLSVDGHKKFYVGSTIKTLNIRLSKHKYGYKQFLIGKMSYSTSFKLCEYANKHNLNLKIELMEAYPCRNRLELEKREGCYMELYKDKIINHRVAGINYRNNPQNYNANYYTDNKIKIILRLKHNYLKNKAKLNAKRKQQFICECGGHYAKCHKSRHIQTNKHQHYLIKK